MLRRFLKLIRSEYLARSNPIKFARDLGVVVGPRCRIIRPTTSMFGSEPYLITLGEHVTVTGGVRFLTHDGGVWVFRDQYPGIDVLAPIVVGNNCFLGAASILMPGVTIGDNCVIGAGSVVTRDIPPDSVAVGCPARVVKTIDEYWESLQGRMVLTKGMNAEGKKNRVAG